MRNLVRKIMCMALVVVVLCGCGKTNEKAGKNVDTENIKIPKYKKVILADLENCNINFIKNMPYTDFDFKIISADKLDEKKLDIKFDTALEYEWSIANSEVEDANKFSYPLLCAYNGYEVKKIKSQIEQISDEDYQRCVIENKNFPKLYVYTVSTQIDMENVKKDGNYEIKGMTVTYDGDEYKFDIGKISVDKKQTMKETFAQDIDGENSAMQTIDGLDYISMDSNFDITLDGIIETYKDKLEIKSIYLKNVDDTIKVKNISISTSNENGTVEFDFDKNGNNIIPKETSTTVVLKCSNDILENNIGSYISPIVCIDYKLGKKTGTLNVPVMARGYSRSAQEIYAYKIDKVDIFNLYLKNLAKEDKE